MKKDEVPQDRDSTYAGQHKLLYAVDEKGNYTGVHSSGWEVESAATRDAIAVIDLDRRDALLRARQGQCSPLEYHMYDRRMDVSLLAQATGLFKWRIRRHFRPDVFTKLSPAIIERYCEALGLTRGQLNSLPEERDHD
ncbi:hypothetical protein ACXYTJ_16635 [Gilvimarinus sp. F26214L]|uniref:hypothetical protein n=1 Tax=Gilvimarinus sp. DZF01 TaxID=3461371 RepID=UPI0040459B04